MFLDRFNPMGNPNSMKPVTRAIYDCILDFPGETVSFLFRETGYPMLSILDALNRLEEQNFIVVDRSYVDPGCYRCNPTLD